MPSNISHNVKALAKAQSAFSIPEGLSPSSVTLPLWAWKYLQMEVEGVQSPHTVEAKKRDIGAFIHWYADANGHMEIDQWMRLEFFLQIVLGVKQRKKIKD